jgi:uncharacterized membrane protein YcaP (DUF421 family)
LPVAAFAGLLQPEARRGVLHVAIVFVVLMSAFRILGKRELGTLSPFELVTLMLIPEIVSNAMQGESNLLPQLAALSTLLLLVTTTSALAHRFKSVEKVVSASATLLVSNGKLLEHAMNEERIQPEELYSEMHKQGIEELRDVKWAILEGTGEITFVLRDERRGARRTAESKLPAG